MLALDSAQKRIVSARKTGRIIPNPMKLITAFRIVLLSLTAFSITGCPRWKHVKDLPSAEPPRGQVTTTEDGSVLTLPNGKKFVSRNSAGITTLTFPNKQVFR